MKKILITISCILLISACSDKKDTQVKFDRDFIEIVTNHGTHKFIVDVADTREKTEQGLMFKKKISDAYGMIFDFGEETKTAFWMKNTYIPLDIIFTDNNGKIVWIYEKAEPMSERLIIPPMMVRGALEINAGLVKSLKIRIGNKINYKKFTNVE